MPTYRVQAPDGKTYRVNAPDGASQEDAIAFVKAQVGGQQQAPAPQPQPPARPSARDLGLEQEGTIRGQITGEGPKLAGRSLNAGRALNFLQGAGFNFADEVLPYTNSALDEAYGAVTGQDAGDFDKNVEYYRNQAKEIGRRMWEERPEETMATQVGGGLASGGLGLTRLAAGTIGRFAPAAAAALRAGSAGLGTRAAQAAVAGAMGGALAGAGSGDDTESRIQGAAVGGVVGAPLGAALPVAGAGLGATGRFLRSTLLPGTVNAERRAGEILGQAVSRSNMQSPTPTQALQTMQQGGVDNATIADLSDELTGLTGAVYRSPGKGKQIVGDFFRARQEGDPTMGQAGGGQWSDILDDISAKVSPSVSTKKAAEAVIAQRAKDAQPLYEKALQGNLASDELADLGNIPAMRAALARGVNLAKQEGALSAQFKLGSGPLPAKVWHYAKMAIDDMIGGATRSGEKTTARTLRIMQDRLLNEMDTLTKGQYGAARSNFAGHSATLNALENGKNILQKSVSAEDIADQLASLTNQAEREFYRAGAAQALRETAARVGRTGNAAGKFLNRGDMQQKLQALFGNQKDYADFMARMMGRGRQYRTYHEVHQGSPTAARLEAGDDLSAGITGGAEPADLVQAAAMGGRQGFVRAAMQRLNDGSVRFLSEKVRTKLAEMLTATDPAKVREAAKMIEMASRMARASQVRASKLRIGSIQGGVLQPATATTER